MHPSVKDGDVDVLPMAHFRSAIFEPLQQLLDSLPGTSAVVVPSVRDLVSDHAVFPQAELDGNVFDDPVSSLSLNLTLALALADTRRRGYILSRIPVASR